MQLCAILQGHLAPVLCLHSNHSLLYSGAEDRVLRIWDLRSNKICQAVDGFPNPITSLYKSDDLLLATSENILYSLDLRKPQVFLSNTSDCTVGTLSFPEEVNQLDRLSLKNATYYAAADDEGNVSIFTLDRLGQPQRWKMLKAHQNICTSVKFRPKRPWQLFTGGMDQCWHLWDFSKPKRLTTCSIPVSGLVENTLGCPFVMDLDVEPVTGNVLVAAMGDGILRAWRLTKQDWVEIPTTGSDKSCLDSYVTTKFLPSNPERIIAATVHGSLEVWKLDEEGEEGLKLLSNPIIGMFEKINTITSTSTGEKICVSGIKNEGKGGGIAIYQCSQ